MLKYEVKKMTFNDLKDKIEIPKFQRGLVWGKSKKIEFIKTLKAGLPVGVLLLSPKNGKYLVIDGLQRFSTMLNYSNNYFEYIDKDEITDIDLYHVLYADLKAKAMFEQLISSAKTTHLENMRKIFISGISSGKGKNLYMISSEITESLINNIAFLSENKFKDIQGIVYSIVERVEKNAQIGSIEIPLIVFTGDENELSVIFQKLNQEGVKLSKYDVFAATWLNHFVTVNNDPSFIEFIINKYENAKNDSDLEIADYDPDLMKQTGKLTVFEYAFALGKAIMKKCDILFPKGNDSKIESIGFLIMAELMGLSYQEMGNLAKKCDEFSKMDFKKFKDAIVESAYIVQNSLKNYMLSPYLPKNKKQTSLCCHSELQIVSYIIVVFKLKYCISPENGIVACNQKKKLNDVLNNLYRHYLYDILRGYWSGSGDSKLEEIIGSPETCRYTKDVDINEFEMIVSSWLGEYNAKQQQQNIPADVKLFLNYLLRLTDIPVSKNSYDIEHCVPKDLLSRYFIKKNIKVPISIPCNLVYIPSKDNRSKGEKTYYQRQQSEPGVFLLDEKQLTEMSYPSKNELKFTDSVASITELNYRSFLENRRKYITNRFIKLMYK